MCFDEEPDDPCRVCGAKSLAALDKLRMERDALDKLATKRATEVNRLTHERGEALASFRSAQRSLGAIDQELGLGMDATLAETLAEIKRLTREVDEARSLLREMANHECMPHGDVWQRVCKLLVDAEGAKRG